MTLREHLERFDPQRDNFAMGWHVDGGFFVEVGDMHFYTRADFDIAARWSRWLTGLCGVPTATPVRAAYAREAPNPPTDTNAGATAVSGPPASDDKAHAEAWSVWQVRLVAEIDMARAVDKSGVPRVHAAVMKWLRRMPPLPVADLYDPYDTQKTPKFDPDLGEDGRTSIGKATADAHRYEVAVLYGVDKGLRRAVSVLMRAGHTVAADLVFEIQPADVVSTT